MMRATRSTDATPRALSLERAPATADDARARQLYDEGARILAALWDDETGLVRYETEFGVFHGSRESLAYADVLLRDGSAESVARAARIIANVVPMQETREGDAHHGNFKWFSEDAGVTDLNAVEFALDHLNALLIDHAGVLSEATLDAMRAMITLGLEAIDRLDVHPSYTNIALSDVCNSVLGGQALGDAYYTERGARRLDEWFEFTNRSGAPHEFNSPTYLAVDIARMAMLAEHADDPAVALKARLAEERLWLHVAAHYHGELAQLAGPHSRSYRDGWTGAGGFLKLMLWRLLGDDKLRAQTPFFPKGREEGHTGVARATLHCPDYVLDWMRAKSHPFESLETTDAAHGVDIATYMTGSYALGTMSRSYGVGEPPEPWPAWNSVLLHFARDGAPKYGTLYARYIVNDKGPGALMYESTRTAEDHWEEGRHVGAQHRNRAIVAYGLQPRTRPAHSNKLSVRMLGVDAGTEIWVGDERVTAFPRTVEAGQPVVVAEGEAYIAMIPLEPSDMGSGATIELSVADGMLTLDLYNYRGPDKTFWEHRSRSGPFYKGNVRNAFILEVAERGEYASADAFREHIALARIADSVDEQYVREIVYASDGGSIAMRYSLWDLSIVERRYDRAPYAAPMARAGALDGGGTQWLQSRDSLIELGGVKLLAGRTPKWVVVDPEGGRTIFVNPSDEEAPLWLETPDTIVECDAFGFGRVAIDARAHTVTVDATGEIAPIRIIASERYALILNGTDVSDSMTVTDGAWTFGGLAS